MAISEYFSGDYAAARIRFRAAAERAGATLRDHPLPQRLGAQGEPLAMDVARLGNPHADCALVVISGTHGVEGFCGSGCQVGLLSDQLCEALPQSACLVLVHALNPFGFSWSRRVNEDGVDLNRNFVDFSQPLPSSNAYEPLHELLVPVDWHGEGRRAADAALAALMQRQGPRAVQTAITGGQYSRPSGLFYGGRRASWSATTLERVLKEALPASVARLAVLDLHTGLGPAAYGEPILTASGPGDLERARRWYGPEVKDLDADESVSARVVGSVADGVRRALPRVDLTFLALEFGTIPLERVLNALRADHWLHAHGGSDEELRAQIGRQMREAFFSQNPAWQAAVYGRTVDFAYRAARGLAERPR
ncbi:MAG TPA: M14 family metallopeptidase [Steroidobacteraceae bacterium]|nr:M14 family metallopeptidase [Steroidobacteraceae bacterium]